MAPPRRVRDEALILRRPGRPDVELVRSRETSYDHLYPTQRRFQVSPDARSLAWSTSRELHVVRRDGASVVLPGYEDGEIRFSPDSKTLALVRWLDGKRRLERVDLHRMQVEPWSEVEDVMWMEYCADGLVVLHPAEKGSSDRALTLLPWSGEPRTIFRGSWQLSRFVVAKQGVRAVAFLGNDVVSIEAPGAEPVVLGQTRILTQNAEMSPDGRAVVIATGSEAYRIDGSGPLATLPTLNVHTVWFSRDGSSFVWANEDGVTWVSGRETRWLPAGEGQTIRAARFLPSSPGLIVTRPREVVRWNPERDEIDVLARAEEGQEMLGADVWAGGLVLWTGTPWVTEGRRWSK